jgi:hypothetical protein
MGTREQTLTALARQAAIIGAVILLSASGMAPSAAAQRHAAATAEPRIGENAGRVRASAAQEVRTVWTDEFGVARPAGLAYDPSRREFLVARDDPTGTAVLRLGPDEDRQGAFRLPRLVNPATLAFDGARDQLTAIDGSEQVTVPGGALEAARPRTERDPIDQLELEAPDSASFDPQTDMWFVLEEGADAVAMVAGDDRTNAPERIKLAPSDTDRLIAFNPSDDLLYIMNARENQVDALDLEGNVQKRFSLDAVELFDPVAMTFAPSTDLTDGPDYLNLYVADSGDDTTLGGVTEVSLAAVTALAAPVDTATLVRTIQTSSWNPASPDPAGIVWMPAADQLAVVDSEVDEVTGAGWHNVNLWRSNRTGSVVGTGALWGPNSAGSYSREPTGLGFDTASNTLFISDDSAKRVFVVKRGGDGTFGTTDDVVTSINTSVLGSNDTEDPEFDPPSGHLFFLDGVGMEIYRINPADGVFGNGNDVMTHFDISHLGPTDFEGLTSNPDRGTLYVGARTTKQIFEITHNGTLVRTISASSVSGLRFISGLAMAPASNAPAQMNLWIVDRAIDNDADPNENDGRIFEITAPNIGGTPTNQPPMATNDAASTTVGAAVTVPVLANDSDPNGDPLTVTNLTQPANGTAQPNTNNTVTYTPNAEFTGSDSFTYTANDGQVDSNVATVTVTVSGAGGGDPQTVVLTFQTSPGGLKLDVDGTRQTATFTRTVIVGSTITISAPSPQTKGSKSYSFTSWSDGGAQTHTIVAPSQATSYTARFRAR